MPMRPLDIKAELVRKDIRITSIARELQYSQGHVSQVMYGLRRDAKTEEAIARKLGLPVDEVFPPLTNPTESVSVAIAAVA